MGETSISWTRYTFNPWWGCLEVSPACKFCYAKAMAKRCGFSGKPGKRETKPVIWGGDSSARRFFPDEHWREPLKWNATAVAAGKRERVFCASMADVFEDRAELIPHRVRLMKLIADTPQLDWLLLTKRPEAWEKLMREVVAADGNEAWLLARDWLDGTPPPNVWMGATAEDQKHFDLRSAALRKVPAVCRFLSMEPLLEAVEVGDLAGIAWVIVGGESGGLKKRRPFEIEWIEAIAARVDAAGARLHIKQDAGLLPGTQGRIPEHLWKRKEFPAIAAA